MSLKNKVEAVLFAVGKRISSEDISKLCSSSKSSVEKVLKELQEDYEKRESALFIFSAQNIWKIDVREKYNDLVRGIVVDTELSRPTMETLSLIAYKKGYLQSDIIKQRGVAAYDHIKELLDIGFISREKEGRSYRLKLSSRFFDYFDIEKDEVDKVFAPFKEDEKALEKSEEELSNVKSMSKNEEKEFKKSLEEREKKSKKNYAERMEEIDKEVEESA